MNVLIAPNSMKGSLDAIEFAATVEQAFRDSSGSFEIRKVPVADGGDLTGKVLSEALGAEKVNVKVLDPIGREIHAEYSISGKIAVIEMADASGIKRMKPEELNPMETSSFGTGQLIKHAIDNGCSEILLGVGGSATVDGGSGMLEALDFQFFGSEGKQLSGNGANLQKIKTIKKSEIPAKVKIQVIADVDNPLLGKNGAARVFGPQKGATPKMETKLEKGLKNWVSLLEKEAGKNLSEIEGAGAAGGIALPLIALFNAEIVPGAEFILKKLNFEKHVSWADLIITGEGKIDAQTLSNKAPVVVARMARKQNKPVIAIGANISYKASAGFDAVFSFINRPLSLNESIKKSKMLLYHFSYELARLLQIFGRSQ
jgi:glycerate kinase